MTNKEANMQRSLDLFFKEEYSQKKYLIKSSSDFLEQDWENVFIKVVEQSFKLNF